MFQATFLGHHSWLFSTQKTNLLVDPLLKDDFGFTSEVELRVYPPRRFDFSRFPALDGVLLTHEHEGHFDIASLHLLDRNIPIYLPWRSSVAMRKILQEMGFSYLFLHPGQLLQLGDLEVLPLSPDQVKDGLIEEWDVLAYLVHDLAGEGSFFSAVDMAPTRDMWKAAKALVPRPGLWAHTNNSYEDHFLDSYRGPYTAGVQRLARSFLEYHQELSEGWEKPEAMLIHGGGFCFGGELRWLNRNAFLTDCQKLSQALSLLLPEEKVLAPLPGQTLSMQGGKLVDSTISSPFASVLSREEWPARQFVGDIELLNEYEPVCGQRGLSPKDLEELTEELRRFAAFLYGGPLFKRLYSLSKEERKPTFVLSLLADDEGVYLFAYDPQSCSFVAVQSDDPFGEYLAGYECWATDLLAFLRCEISSTALSFGRHRSFNAKPEALLFDLNTCLFIYVHPLRQPERALSLYRRVLSEQPKIKPLIEPVVHTDNNDLG